MFEVDLSTKPHLSNKQRKKGVYTGNTLKYERCYFNSSKPQYEFHIQKIDEYNPLYNWQYNTKWNSQVKLSLNKDKRWETFEEVKNDPKFCILENKGGNGRKKVFQQEKQSTEKQPDNVKIIQGKKGKTIQNKRTAGKKVKKVQVKKSENMDDKEYVLEVITPEDKKLTLMKDPSNPKESLWKYSYMKNVSAYKRRETKEQCVL
eukprot:gene101-4350_t